MKIAKSLLIISFLIAGYGCSDESFQTKYIIQAREAADKTQYMIAAERYTKAFNVNPKNDNAKIAVYELADMYLKTGDSMKAQEVTLMYLTVFPPDKYLRTLMDLMLQYQEAKADINYFDFWTKQYLDTFGTTPEETKKITEDLAKRKLNMTLKMFDDRFEHEFYKYLGKTEAQVIEAHGGNKPDRTAQRQGKYDKILYYGDSRAFADNTSDSYTFYFVDGVCKKVHKTIKGTLTSAWQYYPMLYKELTPSFAKRSFRELDRRDAYYITVIWSFDDTIWTANTIQIPLKTFSVADNKEVDIELSREEWRVYDYTAELR